MKKNGGILMIRFLTKLILPQRADPADPAVRARVGKRSGILGILANVLLFAGKLVIGTVSGSVSITADAMNNLSDATSSIVTIVGFRLAERPADENHPYGHARFEYLSGLAVAAMIVVIGFELAKTSFDKILHPEPVVFSGALVAVLLLSIGVKLILAAVNGSLGRAIDSTALLATAADSRNDCIATGAVLLSAVFAHLTSINVDGYAGLAVALFILYSGANTAKETISPLLGEAADPELQRTIVAALRSNDKVLGYHDLMVHDYGPGQRFASVHVEMDMREDVLTCHTIIDDIERQVLDSHGIHLVIHYDPVVTDDEELNRMRTSVDKVLKSIDPRISIHDFRMVRGDTHTNLIFDMILPYDLDDQRQQIKRQLDAAINLGDTQYYTVITFDTGGFNDEMLWEKGSGTSL